MMANNGEKILDIKATVKRPLMFKNHNNSNGSCLFIVKIE